MGKIVHYELTCGDKRLAEGSLISPFLVGRQATADEPNPGSVYSLRGAFEQMPSVDHADSKLVIATVSEREIPRLLMRVDVVEDHLVIKNVHSFFNVQLQNYQELSSQQTANLGTRGLIHIRDFALRMWLASDESHISSLSVAGNDSQSYVAFEVTLKKSHDDDSSILSRLDSGLPIVQKQFAIDMLRTALEAFKQPPGSDAFFEAAGQAAIKIIDLERVAVLSRQGDRWELRSIAFGPNCNRSSVQARAFSSRLLQKMTVSRKTMIMQPNSNDSRIAHSLVEVDRAVAAPIFDGQQKIAGALYGDRVMTNIEDDRPIGDLEASVIDVLATGISSSLALEHEQQLRSSMAQFFSPVVLSQLTADRQLLDSREAEVSVLFCDVRGFSSVTEKIGATKAIDWINDVLTSLSECVLRHDGVLVDYVGDELMAMFGAPTNQPDHAHRACRAALEMLSQIEPLGAKWSETISTKFGFGIGISSGTASVGNTGSKKKFKYGPLGNTVNIASRVQGITKQIGIPGLITGETAKAIQDTNFTTRRLAQVQVVGINQTISLHQLCEGEMQQEMNRRYEEALEAFERSDLKQAAGKLASMVQDYPNDRPTIFLLSRTIEQLAQPDREFDPIWYLTQK